MHTLLHHNITVLDTSMTDPWWPFVKQVLHILSEIYTRPLEPLPKHKFTGYACFIVTCSICCQQVATFLHGYTYLLISFNFLNIAILKQEFEKEVYLILIRNI